MAWWDLKFIWDSADQEFEFYVEQSSRVACPFCGDPLQYAPNVEDASGTELYCKFAGDHTYHVPRDWQRPVRD